MDAEKKPFDLGALAYEDEADLEIVDANGRKTGWVWTFAGPGHPATIAIDNEQTARFVDRQNEIERTQVNGRKWKGGGETADTLRERGINYIVARLLRWSDMTMDGAPFPCTPDNVRKLLADRRFGLVYDQANAFLIDEKSFTKRSPKN
jgi:hypothetical protein